MEETVVLVKVGLSNYATKVGLKNATGIATSKLVAKSDLVSLKADVDKLDIDKLIPVPANLSKLSNVVKNDVVKKTLYDKLITKVNKIDFRRFALETNCDTDKSNLGKKIPDTTGVIMLNYNIIDYRFEIIMLLWC